MELLIYKASAGSGKTFTLAVEYIKHLILNPRAYRLILAVTFTNKATTEMKERILQQLYGIASGDPASEVYLKRIRMDIDLSESEIRRAARTALQYMLHDYSRFRVETIDSFFQSVMRNLARELELSPSLNIELNNTEVLSKAVDSLIEKLTPDSPVLIWLLDYINDRIANDKRWNVSGEVKQFGWNLFDENYIERGEELRRQLQDPGIIGKYRNKLREMSETALKQMKGFHDRFELVLSEHNLSPDELKNGSKGISSYFRKLRDGEISDKKVLNSTLNNCLEDAEQWSTKTSPRKEEVIRLAEEVLMPLLRDSETYRSKNSRIVNSCLASTRHLEKLQLLAHIDEEVRTLNKEENRFLLSDTNALLHKLVKDKDSSFVFEKTGTNIRTVMIDEFQDTSRMQWDNFRILLLEGLSQGANSLIVGDVKQSIYRWRNGDWRILNDLGKSSAAPFPFPIRIETLKTNHRSEANIIRFNNRLFTAAVEYLNILHQQDVNEECLSLQRAYADVIQESPRKEEKGYVKATFLTPDEETGYQEQTLHALGDTVRELLDSGIRQKDITILVRKNKNIPLIAHYFEQTLQLAIVSDEAFRMDASHTLCMIMDALRYLSNPQERIAGASLAAGYRQQTGNDDSATTEWDRILTAPLAETLPDSFVSHMEELRLMPLYELLEELLDIFRTEKTNEEEAYFFSFFDALTEYQKTNSSDIDAFIRYWDETLCRKTIPGGEVEGIRIFSIHKSKGLEFHTVLIPFCDWKLENERNDQLLWCSPQEEPFNMLDIVPVNYSSQLIESVYRQDYLDERLQLWVDNLNLLYVAFTRAEKNLFIWSKLDEKGTVSELLANVLPQAASPVKKTDSDETNSYETGTLCLSEEREKNEKTSHTNHNRLARKATKRLVTLESLKHDIRFRQSNRSSDFIRDVDEEESEDRFIKRGRLFHTLFSTIETIADIDRAIERLVFEGIISNKESEEEIRVLTREAFSLPQVQDWYSGSWRLFNECEIIWLEHGTLKNRRPDRVMMRGEEVVVIDFKFGKPHKQHAKQIQEYMHLLIRMGYPKEQIKGYLWYVEEDSIQEQAL